LEHLFFLEPILIKKVFRRQYKNPEPSYFEHMFTVWNGYCGSVFV